MLLFRLKFAKTYRVALQESERTGRPLPRRLQAAPELIEGLEIYLDAFDRLDSGRSGGLGLTRISWMQIEEYCDRLGVFDHEQRAIFHRHLTAMDEAYLEHQKEGHGNKTGKNFNTSKLR